MKLYIDKKIREGYWQCPICEQIFIENSKGCRTHKNKELKDLKIALRYLQ